MGRCAARRCLGAEVGGRSPAPVTVNVHPSDLAPPLSPVWGSPVELHLRGTEEPADGSGELGQALRRLRQMRLGGPMTPSQHRLWEPLGDHPLSPI